jgi:hypothetical protein
MVSANDLTRNTQPSQKRVFVLTHFSLSSCTCNLSSGIFRTCVSNLTRLKYVQPHERYAIGFPFGKIIVEMMGDRDQYQVYGSDT